VLTRALIVTFVLAPLAITNAVLWLVSMALLATGNVLRALHKKFKHN
jgi:hypothetical protein